jgi:hypothetical protein
MPSPSTLSTRPPKAVDVGDQRSNAGVDQPLDPLRVEMFGQRGVADEVGEHHGDHPALLRRKSDHLVTARQDRIVRRSGSGSARGAEWPSTAIVRHIHLVGGSPQTGEWVASRDHVPPASRSSGCARTRGRRRAAHGVGRGGSARRPLWGDVDRRRSQRARPVVVDVSSCCSAPCRSTGAGPTRSRPASWSSAPRSSRCSSGSRGAAFVGSVIAVYSIGAHTRASNGPG